MITVGCTAEVPVRLLSICVELLATHVAEEAFAVGTSHLVATIFFDNRLVVAAVRTSPHYHVGHFILKIVSFVGALLLFLLLPCLLACFIRMRRLLAMTTGSFVAAWAFDKVYFHFCWAPTVWASPVGSQIR